MQAENNKILVSISFVSNRIRELAGMFNSIDLTTTNPQRVEIIVGIDEHDELMRKFLDEEIKQRKFQIKYLISPYEGFEKLWKAFNKMHKLCDKDAYFVQHSNDEMRFLTPAWDEKLEKYIGLIEDGIFRLRLSKFKLFNYASFTQALGQPDNFAIHTKKWIDITGWCDCHSADVYQQMISLYLSRGCPEWSFETMFYRDIPIFDIEIGGLEAGAGETEKEIKIRNERTQTLWTIAMSKPIQTLIQYQANLLRAAILTHNKPNLVVINKPLNNNIEIYEFNKEQNVGNLLYSFTTYTRQIQYNASVSDTMLCLTDKIRKPKWLKKYKLSIFWPLVKLFLILKKY